MTDEQPEPLRLADELYAIVENGADPDVIYEAAAELRRQHAELDKVKQITLNDEALLQQALEALQAYGAHTPTCDHLMLLTSLPPQRKPCSCGLVAIITALKERLK